MDYLDALAYLDGHIAYGIRPGLERIEGLLDDTGRPHDGYPIIHVAGTNGKTSTSRFATLLLVAHGLNTGTYTSPHLQKVEERLAINGRIATDEEFALAVSDVAAFADLRVKAGAKPNTYFELTTAAELRFWGCVAAGATLESTGRERSKPGRAIIVQHREALRKTEIIAGQQVERWKAGHIPPRPSKRSLRTAAHGSRRRVGVLVGASPRRQARCG